MLAAVGGWLGAGAPPGPAPGKCIRTSSSPNSPVVWCRVVP
jgi:hypothetical protein